MTDAETDPIGHGDQHDRKQPDQRDESNAAIDTDGSGDAANVPDEPIAGTEPDVSDAPDSPSDSSSDAAGRKI